MPMVAFVFQLLLIDIGSNVAFHSTFNEKSKTCSTCLASSLWEGRVYITRTECHTLYRRSVTPLSVNTGLSQNIYSGCCHATAL